MKEYYRSKSSDELKALLRADAGADSGRALEPEEAWEILAALDDKEPSPETVYTPADAAWERFRRSYLEPMERRTAAETLPPSLRRPPRRRPAWARSVGGSNIKAAAAALITAALISAASVSAYAAGADARAAVPWEYEAAEDSSCEFEHASLQSALYFLGVSDLSAPKALPEGFVCTGARTVNTRIRSVLLLRCSGDGGAEITMSVAVSGEGVGSAFPKRNGALKKYIPDGDVPVSYLVGASGGSSEAYWKDGRYECALYGECSLEELEKMLDSIEKTPPYPADSGR